MRELSQQSGPTLSVVIPVYNGEQFIGDCLESLRVACDGLVYEVICVDDCSSDKSYDILKAQPGVTVIRHEQNSGFARACNAGMEVATGAYLLLLNQDTRIHPDAVRKLLEKLKTDKKIAFIGPKFVGFDGRLQKMCSGFPTPHNVLFRLIGLAKLFPASQKMNAWSMTWFSHEEEMFVDQPMGAALLFRRELIDEIGLLDESFPIYLNDVDWARRAVEAGYRNLYYPQAIVEHYVGSATRPQKPRMIHESHRALRRYLRKWFPGMRYALLRIIDTALLWVTAHIRALGWRLRRRD